MQLVLALAWVATTKRQRLVFKDSSAKVLPVTRRVNRRLEDNEGDKHGYRKRRPKNGWVPLVDLSRNLY